MRLFHRVHGQRADGVDRAPVELAIIARGGDALV